MPFSSLNNLNHCKYADKPAISFFLRYDFILWVRTQDLGEVADFSTNPRVVLLKLQFSPFKRQIW